MIFLHHPFVAAGGLFLDSKQVKSRVRSAKLTWDKDTAISHTFRAVLSATSRYSDTEQVSHLAY